MLMWVQILVFSVDENANKALVCVVPRNKSSQLNVLESLNVDLKPLEGKDGGGKGDLTHGQVSKSLWLLNFGLSAQTPRTFSLNPVFESFLARQTRQNSHLVIT